MTESTDSMFDIADKIQKLLNKAESAGPAEAEALTEKAMKLMARHAITAAELDAKRKASGHAGEKIITDSTTIVTGSYAVPILSLFWRVIRQSDNIEGFQSKRNGTTTLHLVGYESDVAQFKILLTSLEIQALMAMRVFWKSPETAERMRYATGSMKWNERRTFVDGFSLGVEQRLARVRHESDAAPGTDLVLARGAEVKAFVESNYQLKTAAVRRAIVGSSSARAAGHRAGLNAATGGSAVSNRTQLGG